MVEIDHVSFRYSDGRETLCDLSLTISPGECVLLCGESGCGKTTVTKLINGLIPHFVENSSLQGFVRVKGISVSDTELYELANYVGSVFQNPKSQFFNLDTDSELTFGLENQGTAPGEMRRRLENTIKQLHIQSLLHRNIFTLSGGEKQTLAFASVYAMEPSVFVLDEPTANLDEQAVWRLREQILLLKQRGHTVIIAEHRLYFLRDLIDRAVYIKSGRLVKIFPGDEFWQLSDEEREGMGLRRLIPADIQLPAVQTGETDTGLSVQCLTCGYKRQPPVLRNLSFSVSPGEVLAIMGPNGVGKTTLTRCLCGLLKERSGRIVLDGKPLSARECQRTSFLVMQEVNHQLFCDSVWNECEQAAGDDSAQIETVLSRFDLLSFRDRHPMALSGGQKQRLAVAAALLSGRRVLIFDEPTSGLDYRHMLEVSAVIRSLAEAGHIILVVSHDKELVQTACDRILAFGNEPMEE